MLCSSDSYEIKLHFSIFLETEDEVKEKGERKRKHDDEMCTEKNEKKKNESNNIIGDDHNLLFSMNDE